MIRVRDRGAGRAADDQYAVAAFGGRIVPVLGRAVGPPSLAHVERVSRPTGLVVVIRLLSSLIRGFDHDS